MLYVYVQYICMFCCDINVTESEFVFCWYHWGLNTRNTTQTKCNRCPQVANSGVPTHGANGLTVTRQSKLQGKCCVSTLRPMTWQTCSWRRNDAWHIAIWNVANIPWWWCYTPRSNELWQTLRGRKDFWCVSRACRGVTSCSAANHSRESLCTEMITSDELDAPVSWPDTQSCGEVLPLRFGCVNAH